ncbi:GNAT family N-acetyltransferase [Actinoplanes derwentensis]|uniref:Acetyltransferase (GNAT) domain-containing protein n=1 Tax=Actinoplanes derwentensis TaxID=113562 RepID=A0A1H1WY02_9ACTN|nr:GNAT family N-acetyltransferase [Actinoplanes derwentensis]GID86955.1 hypothetical protein Ade03nite_58790 [Actinoplanes derwentensis]SDT01236.1 Acetyltransferase (GNAT) domain-containing protein [Actinoplanes derwentensis]
MRSWVEDDGVRIYLIETAALDGEEALDAGTALDAGEDAVRRIVAEQGITGPVTLGGNAVDGDHAREALLVGRGYRRVFTMIEMRRDAGFVPASSLPEGFRVRTATGDDAGALWRLARRAWAGRAFVSLPSEDRLRDWLRRSDLSTFEVVTAGDRIAAFAAVVGDEIDDLVVDPDFQRRGLASVLLSRALTRLGGTARLRTEAHDPSGARTLYERFGFQVTAAHHRYRKPLR